MTPTGQPTSLPSSHPSAQPVGQPSSVPSGQPTSLPSVAPTRQPTSQPSGQPTVVPTCQPSATPSGQPSARPSGSPTGQPTIQPSVQPTSSPTGQPSGVPSGKPTSEPTSTPTTQPTSSPSGAPTGYPSSTPTAQPSRQPTSRPSTSPTVQPTTQPTSQPSVPTSVPSVAPSFDVGQRYDVIYEALTVMHNALFDSYDAAKQYNFGEKDYYKTRREGTCGMWGELLSVAASESSFYTPKALVFSSMSTIPTQDMSILSTHDYGPYTATCTDGGALETLTERLFTVTDSSSLSVGCDGRTWNIATCSAQGDDTGEGTAMCVDCTNPCDVATRCTQFNESTFALAPCNIGGCLDYISDNSLPDNDKSQVLSLSRRKVPCSSACRDHWVTSVTRAPLSTSLYGQR